MCIFSGSVKSVSSTRIFARTSNAGVGPALQTVVYQMKYAADNELAMILPLPVLAGVGETDNAVKFIDFSKHADFFDRLDEQFQSQTLSDSMSFGSRGMKSARPTLEVHSVGDFEASYVPTLDDFDRLDERFKLPRQTWDQVPQYGDYGFAVFKLKLQGAQTPVSQMPKPPGIQMPSAHRPDPLRHMTRLDSPRRPQGRMGPTEPHPMAFTFPTRWPDGTFFPTVHIHDGQVHQTEEFDHALYTQVNTDVAERLVLSGKWRGSHGGLGDIAPAGVVATDRIGYKATLKGTLSNIDVILR